MNTISVHPDYYNSIFYSIQKSKKQISLSFILIEFVPFLFARSLFNNRVAKAYGKMLEDLKFIDENITILDDEKLQKAKSLLIELHFSLTNFEELISQQATKFIHENTIKTINEVHKKTLLILEMVDLNLDTDLISELNEAILEIKS